MIQAAYFNWSAYSPFSVDGPFPLPDQFSSNASHPHLSAVPLQAIGKIRLRGGDIHANVAYAFQPAGFPVLRSGRLESLPQE